MPSSKNLLQNQASTLLFISGSALILFKISFAYQIYLPYICIHLVEIPFGKSLKWESGDSATAEESGAVPAAVSPRKFFLKSPCHCPATDGREGLRKTGKPEDLPGTQ
jgi:hypothetical protein